MFAHPFRNTQSGEFGVPVGGLISDLEGFISDKGEEVLVYV